MKTPNTQLLCELNISPLRLVSMIQQFKMKKKTRCSELDVKFLTWSNFEWICSSGFTVASLLKIENEFLTLFLSSQSVGVLSVSLTFSHSNLFNIKLSFKTQHNIQLNYSTQYLLHFKNSNINIHQLFRLTWPNLPSHQQSHTIQDVIIIHKSFLNLFFYMHEHISSKFNFK